MATDAEADANLDEFLSLLENDPDYQETITDPLDSANGDVKNSQEIETSAKNSPRKALKDLTYEDIFGSPEKKKRKKSDLSNEARGDQAGTSSSSVSRNLMSELGSKPIKPSSLVKNPSLLGLDTIQLVIDPHSRIRLYKTSIALYYGEESTTEAAVAALKERNFGLQFVNLMAFTFWYRTKGAEQKNFWICGVLTRKLPGVRKSAKGNEYVIWEINDLKQLDKSWNIFLFSSAASSQTLSAIPIGSLIDITTPSVMDSKNGGAMKLSLSVNNYNQIKLIGTSKDFGLCQSKRKDGKDCTAVVNTWECCTCIHHASSELKKINGKKNSKGKKNFVSFENGTNFYKNSLTTSQSCSNPIKPDGIVTMNFGRPCSGSNKAAAPNNNHISMPGKGYARMELQGTSVCNELKRNSLNIGNANSISFKKEHNEFLVKVPQKAPAIKQQIDLDPLKTRHLTERDRMILAALHSPLKGKDKEKAESSKVDKNKSFNIEIASQIASNPNAASRNFLKYLTGNDRKVEEKEKTDNPLNIARVEVEPVTLTRETIRNMKKALDFVKNNGPIKKQDPNAISKRKSLPADFKAHTSTSKTIPSSSITTNSNKPSTSKTTGIDFKSEEFKKILTAKSVHEEHLADVQQEEYFDKLVKKEAIENKLLTTYAIATNAVMCKQCKYVALSQSDFCKEAQHQIRVVKATKRFFKCKDCGNRTMSLDRLPKHPCKQCHSSSWISAPVGKEKKGPVLQSEVLSVRGNEEKFIGSSGSKMFLSLEVE